MTDRHKFPPTHGLYAAHRAEYRAWQELKQRCLTDRNPSFKHYGARGIGVCERWTHSFPAFLEDMGARPDGASIDRIDNDKGYSPDNCRWATKTIQSRNIRRSTAVHSGVYFESASQSWVARITVDHRAIRLGAFPSKDLAAAARKEAEVVYWHEGRKPPPKGTPPRNNTSGFVGVSQLRHGGNWQAYYGSRRTRVHIGNFGSANEAASARGGWMQAHGSTGEPT